MKPRKVEPIKEAQRVKVTAVNLATGEEQTYVGMSPSEAVHAAWQYSRGNVNTQEYTRLYLNHYSKLQWGKAYCSPGRLDRRVRKRKWDY